MKKVLSLIIALACVFSLASPAVALYEDPFDPDEDLIWINDLNNIPYESTYSFEELYEILSNNGYSASEAEEFIGSPQPAPTDKAARSTERRIALYESLPVTISQSGAIYVVNFRVNICMEYDDGHYVPDRFVYLTNGRMYTGDGAYCNFSGSASYTLLDYNCFHYSYSGDVYRDGTCTWPYMGTVYVGDPPETKTYSNSGGSTPIGVAEDDFTVVAVLGVG